MLVNESTVNLVTQITLTEKGEMSPVMQQSIDCRVPRRG